MLYLRLGGPRGVGDYAGNGLTERIQESGVKCSKVRVK